MLGVLHLIPFDQQVREREHRLLAAGVGHATAAGFRLLGILESSSRFARLSIAVVAVQWRFRGVTFTDE
ncbi:hypothetical protein C5E43_26280 [Nocardia cyriacigeorgica]|nr:hypothetical protein C5E43_26280 [Nocardia cyriacigeorgica]